MLVLARKKGQSIVIDGNIKVVVTRTAGGTVRLGIEAPKGVSIVRTELIEAQDTSGGGGKESEVGGRAARFLPKERKAG